MEISAQEKIDRILKKNALNKPSKPQKEVIYGLYDASRQSLVDRIDDFLVDHSKVPLDQKAYFFHLLAVMIDAGIPMMQAVKILSTRSKSERLRRVLTTVAYNLRQGNNLSSSLSRFPDIFGEMEIGVVKSGEAAGNLDKMLFRLSGQLDKSNELQIKLITASIYPLAVLIVLILAASGMLIFVIPSLVNLLKEGGLQEENFPVATLFLINFSRFLTSYWWAVISGGVIGYLLFNIWKNSEDGKYTWDIFKLKLPVVGELLRKVYVLRFISTLGILIESGLPIIQALQIVAGSMSSKVYALKTWEVISRVQQGDKISESLMDTPFLFPETITQMLAIGEQTASVSKISEKISEHYDQEIDHSLKRLMSLFEPIMIVFVGATVALLALAILSPIFKLSTLV